jgi:uncharacterized protein HemX
VLRCVSTTSRIDDLETPPAGGRSGHDGRVTQLPTAARPVLVPGQRSRPDAEALQPPVPRPPLLRERPRRRERSAGGGALVAGLLVVALVLALGAAAYLWAVSDAWQQRAESSESQRAQLVSTSQQLQQRVEALQADLAASDARVEQLAAEKARATDLREAADR